MPLIQLKKTTAQTAKPVDSSAWVRPVGKPNLGDVLRRLERDVQKASAKPQVKMVKRHEAATMLGVSIRTLQRWHEQQYGPHRSIGKRFHYVQFEIEEWIANHGRGGKRSDLSERSPKNTNSNPVDKPTAVDCTKVDTPMAFNMPEDANSTPCDNPATTNCTKVDTQNEVSGMLVAGSSDV